MAAVRSTYSPHPFIINTSLSVPWAVRPTTRQGTFERNGMERKQTKPKPLTGPGRSFPLPLNSAGNPTKDGYLRRKNRTRKRGVKAKESLASKVTIRQATTKKPTLFSRFFIFLFLMFRRRESFKKHTCMATDHITDSLILQRVSRRRFSERKRALSGASALESFPVRR
ncbi:hypothetical protein LZ31DRAFT_244780 [Colletotrichum somersetense]|nr:hypothetical protein LZ31DRAFT_244780 [Colletotrichum somersetense]